VRIGLMTRSLEIGAPIADDVINIWSTLKRRGYEVFVFTASGETSAPLVAYHYDDVSLLLSAPGDLVIFFTSGQRGDDAAILRMLHCQIAIRLYTQEQGTFPGLTRLERDRWRALPISAMIVDAEGSRDVESGFGPLPQPPLAAPQLRDVADDMRHGDHDYTLSQLRRHRFNVLTEGCLRPSARVELLIDAVHRASLSGLDIKLHVVGEHLSEYQSYIAEIAARRNDKRIADRVTFYGLVSPQARANFFMHCDLYCTSTEHLGYDFSIVSALAFGTPILALRNAVLERFVGDATEFAEAPPQFVERLLELSSNVDAREALASRGRKRFEEKFSRQAVERAFNSAIDSVLDAVRRSQEASLARAYDWFDVPDANLLIADALAVADKPDVSLFCRSDARLDFIDWILRDGRRLSAETERRLASPEFAAYAESLYFPACDMRVSPNMRLVWKFHRYANARFPLTTRESIACFTQWYNTTGRFLYPPVGAAISGA